jgi:hypothetical protein
MVQIGIASRLSDFPGSGPIPWWECALVLDVRLIDQSPLQSIPDRHVIPQTLCAAETAIPMILVRRLGSKNEVCCLPNSAFSLSLRTDLPGAN